MLCALCGVTVSLRAANIQADAGTNVPSRQWWNTQSFSVWSLLLLLWLGTAVGGGVRNASKRSFTIT
jgi:hypothetical protein